MKFLNITVLFLLISFCNTVSFSQTGPKDSGSKPGYEYWDETVLRFKAVGMTSLKEKTFGETNYEVGYGGSMTLQFPISRPVSLYAELIIGGIKTERWESVNGVPHVKSNKIEPVFFSQAGVRIYPSRTELPLYLKTGISLPYVIIPLPILTAGAGYEFIISDKIGVYPEVELFTSFIQFSSKSTSLIFGLGLELFH